MMSAANRVGRVDFFVSYAGSDRPWAEWAAHQLEVAGYSVELDVWDWEVGSNFVLNMDGALERARQVLVLCSSAYFDRERFTTDEWTAVQAGTLDRDGPRRLVPVRVEDVRPPRILAPLIYRDLFGLEEDSARAALLEAVGGSRRRPTLPPFPSAPPAVQTASPRLPGVLPSVWNVPRRHPAFTGREALLARLRDRLTSGSRAVVQALHGMGGVGKTQLAIEYAHLFAGEYTLVWWINAERGELIDEQIAALATAANWANASSTRTATAKYVLDRLRTMSHWLLVFDNAEDADQLALSLPSGQGHIIITSRGNHLTGLAAPIPIDVFTRSESLAMLKQYLPMTTDDDMDGLAAAVEDLPLALTQAASLISETRMTVRDYLLELRQHGAELLSVGKPPGYPVPLGAGVETSLRSLNNEDPAAVQLLHLCAFMAPEPIPVVWFNAAPVGVLAEPLATVVTGRLAFRRTLGRLARFGLARITETTVQLHRFTQAVLRDQCHRAPGNQDQHCVEQIAAAAVPADDVGNPASWPSWAALLPHLLALDPANAGPELRSAGLQAVLHLGRRGQFQVVSDILQIWHEAWLNRLGPEHRDVLAAAHHLTAHLRELGEYQRARTLGEETLAVSRLSLGDDHPIPLGQTSELGIILYEMGEYEPAHSLVESALTRRRRVLGEDHPDTLMSAHHLGLILSAVGKHDESLSLNEDTVARRRRVLGDDDHLHTITVTINLAESLRHQGQHDQARLIDEENQERAVRVLGPDHPATLMIALNVAADVRYRGDPAEAYRRDKDTVSRTKTTLGEDHPETLYAMESLAADLRALGEYEQARQLDEETLSRRRRVLGENHPDTLQSVEHLTLDLHESDS
ncbi:FxSxx-COOH system tetratricopeptide repeat protein [Paractinoplanes rishiriensis]|uniref:ATP-binding protein n=1 Tax=Paractinoplanes rishiriensis TaxID=1050105 RepID=A0A919KB85_9ACTN|nr:FxSxx-COOH system tetratricopeptide repeat protein [Actinoplanes rishiriensis]GIF02296.1 ATP-binding protein [Actinoplanes rishiriensis]